MISDRLRDYFESILEESLGRLEDMVAINSHTRNVEGVRALGEHTARLFEELGFRAEFIPSRHGYGDHLALVRGEDKAPKVALISHLDTVFSAQEELDNDFAWRREGDRLYGPGTVDIKGGTVVALMTLRALRKFFPEQFEAARWVFLLNSSEEVGASDFSDICADRIGEDALASLVFEGGLQNDKGGFKIVCARRGIAVCEIEAIGRRAHAGSAHEFGANAIVQVARIVERLAALTDYGRGLTCNVGVVRGGTAINAVPDRAVAEAEMRCFQPEPLEEAVRAVDAMAGPGDVASAKDGFPCQVKVVWTDRLPAWPENPQTEAIFHLWRETAERFLGVSAEVERRGGLSDGNRTWRFAPTIDGLGPAGSNAHCSVHDPKDGKEQEYALASSFVPKAMVNTLAIARLLGADLGGE